MAAIYKHKKHGFQINFRIYFPDGSNLQKYRYASLQTDADILRSKAEYLENGSRSGCLNIKELAAARRDGLISEAEAVLMSGGRAVAAYDLDLVLERYEASSAIANTPYGHRENMRRARRWKRWLKKHPIPSLTEADVKQYVLGRSRGTIAFTNKKTGYAKVGVAQKTIRNEMEILRALIDEAIKAGMVEKNVARDVDVPVKNQRLRRAMSSKEVQLLVATAIENRHLCHGLAYEMIMVALYTGLRRNELRTLTWDDINFEERLIFVQAKEIDIDGEDDFTTKSGEPRSVGIPDRLFDMLSGMERNGPWVFGGAQPIVANRLYKTFKEICARAGLDPDLSLHHSRHTYTSRLLKHTGGDLRFVQDRVGHLDIETTKKYTHVIENEDAPEKDFDY